MAEATSAMPNAPEIQVSWNGLTELYRPPDEESVVAHVIFIHGLFGSPDKTWTKDASGRTAMKDDGRDVLCRSVFWPRELLPKIVPRTTVQTWGYDADIDNFMQPASRNSLYQHAGNLLADLCDLRDTFEDKAIPFIFIAHSLGGLIVKDALNRSSSEIGTRIKDIAPHTFAICFLGTPHRGSKLAKSGTRAIALKMLASSRQPNVKLMQALQHNSEILDRIGSSFFQTVDKYGFQIASFCEETEIRLFSIINLFIVEPDSAKIGHSKEETGTIPADHRNMAKFGSESDTGFSRVSRTVKRWVETNISSKKDEYFDCLQSLKIPEADVRYQQVVKNHDRTFGWLFEKNTVQFIDWLRETKATGPAERLFWITGKPGSGKSTIMKHAIRNSKTMDHLQASGVRGWHMIPFFFSDRGSEEQRIFQTMLHEILYQLLGQIEDAFSLILPLYRRLGQVQKTTIPKWDTTTLREGISEVIGKSTSKAGICLFMDALDEHSGDNENLCKFFWDLSNESEGSILLKICLASRPWPVFKRYFGGCRGFAIHEHTENDIRHYVISRLYEVSESIEVRHMGTEGQTQEEPDMSELAQDVTINAQGVFIWVRLVVDELFQGITEGTPIAILRKTLKNIPHELEDLYARALSKIKRHHAVEAHVLLHMVVSSLSPLDSQVLLNFASWLLVGQVATQTSEAQARRLASRTGCLLEVVDSSGSFIVQFLHQTAREYVRSHINRLGLKYSVPVSLGSTLFTEPLESSSPLHLIAVDEFPHTRGPEFLLLCGILNRSFSESILPHIFTYAKEVDKEFASFTKTRKRLARKSLSRLLDRGYLWENSPAYSSLLSFTAGPSKTELVIAANWTNMVADYLTPDVNMTKAIHLAALGPSFVEDCVDRIEMVRVLVGRHPQLHPTSHEHYRRNRFEEWDMMYSTLREATGGFGAIKESDRRRMLESVNAVAHDVEGSTTLLKTLVSIESHPLVSEREMIQIAAVLLENGGQPFEERSSFTLRLGNGCSVLFRTALSFCLHFRSAEWVNAIAKAHRQSSYTPEEHQALAHCLASRREFSNPAMRAIFLRDFIEEFEKDVRPIPEEDERAILGAGWPLVWFGSQFGIVGFPHITRGFCSSGYHQ